MISRSGLIIASVSTVVGIAESIIAYNIAIHGIGGGVLPFKLRMPPIAQLAVTFITLSIFGYLTGVIADHFIHRIEQKKIMDAARQHDPEAQALLAQQADSTAKSNFFAVKPIRFPILPVTDNSITY